MSTTPRIKEARSGQNSCPPMSRSARIRQIMPTHVRLGGGSPPTSIITRGAAEMATPGAAEITHVETTRVGKTRRYYAHVDTTKLGRKSHMRHQDGHNQDYVRV